MRGCDVPYGRDTGGGGEKGTTGGGNRRGCTLQRAQRFGGPWSRREGRKLCQAREASGSHHGVLCSAGRESVSVVEQGDRDLFKVSLGKSNLAASHGRKDWKEKTGRVGVLCRTG